MNTVLSSSKSKPFCSISASIKLPNHHPPIIEKEEFYKVQELYTKRKQSQPHKSRKHLLFGKVFCGCCGRRLRYSGGKYPVFNCVYTNADPNAPCYKMKVKASTLESTVLATVKKQAEVVLNIDSISDLPKNSLGQLQIDEHESHVRQLTEQIQANYEQLVTGQIDRETFAASKGECSKQIERLKNRIDSLKQSENAKLENQKLATLAENALGVTESISQRSIIESVVEKIIVSLENQIKIVWKFADFGVNAV